MREHGLTEVFRSASAALLGERLHLQFVFLLFELLDDSVVEVERQIFQGGRAGAAEIGFGGDALPQSEHQPDGKYKGSSRREQHQYSPQDQRIAKQIYHQNLPYQRKNWLPTKNASKAMLPRKTPKGI